MFSYLRLRQTEDALPRDGSKALGSLGVELDTRPIHGRNTHHPSSGYTNIRNNGEPDSDDDVEPAHPSAREWIKPAMWCGYANASVLLINVIITAAAIGITAKSHQGSLGFGPLVLYHGSCSKTKGSQIGLHLLINVLSVTLTATSSYCCHILSAPSRQDVDKAHSSRILLPIGTFSVRTLVNLNLKRKVLWALLSLTSLAMQLMYNSVVYSSTNSNSYAAIMAPPAFVNASIPIADFSAETCFQTQTGWNETALRSALLNGDFQRLDVQQCIDAYFVDFISDRRTLVTVTADPTSNNSLYMTGTGYGVDKSILSGLSENYEEGIKWMCSGLSPDGYSSCQKSDLSSSSWELDYDTFPSKQTVLHVPDTSCWFDGSNLTSVQKVSNVSDTDLDTLSGFLWNGTTENQLRPVLDDSSLWEDPAWAAALQYSSTTCIATTDSPSIDGPSFVIDYCLSQQIDGDCELLYHLPIAVAMMVCILTKTICIFVIIYEDRRELFLTVGDAISSFLQRQDPTTMNWCMLSRPADDPNRHNDEYSWHSWLSKEDIKTPPTLPPPPFPEKPPTGNRRWGKATTAGRWMLTIAMLAAYIAITIILSEEPREGSGRGNYSIGYSMWQIKGFGTVQTNNLLTTLSSSFVALELLVNTPQLVLSLLYFLFNDHLTRMLMAAEYNDFSHRRKPLRVSFPRGQQQPTFRLAIPYRYSVPLLLAFVLIHWFVSEGVFYVAIVPYDIIGDPVPDQSLSTCAVSVIPLQVAMYLTILLACAVIWLSRKRFKGPKMPLAFNCSAAISAACHPPPDDRNAAFEPVMWGEVDMKVAVDEGESFPHCSFSSMAVSPPREDVLYA